MTIAATTIRAIFLPLPSSGSTRGISSVAIRRCCSLRASSGGIEKAGPEPGGAAIPPLGPTVARWSPICPPPPAAWPAAGRGPGMPPSGAIGCCPCIRARGPVLKARVSPSSSSAPRSSMSSAEKKICVGSSSSSSLAASCCASKGDAVIIVASPCSSSSSKTSCSSTRSSGSSSCTSGFGRGGGAFVGRGPEAGTLRRSPPPATEGRPTWA